jgi:hypothetical protein
MVNGTGEHSSRYGFPLVLAAAILVLLLLALSGCDAPLNAVSPVATQGSTPAASGTPGASSMVATLAPEGKNTSGTGTARLQVNSSQQTICSLIHVSGIELPSTAAHIHRGSSGINGPIVVHLAAPNAQGFSSGCTSAPSAVITALLQHPADYYVNVHNATYPEGAVRGQLAMCGGRISC